MSQLETLTKYREAILLAEIGAWLHMLGKYDWQFIETQCGDLKGYDYKNFMLELNPGYPELFKLLSPKSTSYQHILSTLPIEAPTNVGVFIRDHQETKKARDNKLSDQVTMLLVDAHGRGSNIEKSEFIGSKMEKNDPRFFPHQSIPDVYLFTAFGFAYQLNSATYKTATLHQELEKLVARLQSPDTDWGNLVRELRQQLINHFRVSLAETRLPFNDVTILDQTAATVAFFKAALAERVIAGAWKPLMSGAVNQYRWRTLTIPFVGLSYLGNISGISDLLARQQCLFQAQNAVQTLLEVTYPVGQEVYRDEQICVYLVPDDPNLLEWQTSDKQTLEELIQRAITEATQGELYPDLQRGLLDRGSRTLYTAGQEIRDVSQQPVSSDTVQMIRAWDDVPGREICANCGIRPQGPSKKAEERKVCDVCLNRRNERAKEWANRKLGQTIWLDEVADVKGRLALLVGSWGLERWLDGLLIGTVIAAPKIGFVQLKEDCRQSLMTTKKDNPQQFCGLLKDLFVEAVRNQFNNQFRLYFQTIIQPEWRHLSTTNLPEETMAAIYLIRQNPSFARLRRVWQTTRQFWQEVCPTGNGQSLKDSIVGKAVGQRPARLEIRGALNPAGKNGNLGFYHAYELKLSGDIALGVVWDAANDRFITCENLDYLAKPELLGRPVLDFLAQGKTIAIEEPSGYGSQNKTWGAITIEKAEKLEGSAYTPAIPILAEPRTFMALVPADKALDILCEIRNKYEREMGKVRNRLPLHLGVVYAHRRTPLRAILDAGRRMLQQQPLGGQKAWKVEDIEDVSENDLPPDKKNVQQFKKTTKVQLEQDGCRLTWYIPAVMGDGQTEDVWYPYVFFHADENGNGEPGGRDLVFKGLRPAADGDKECWLVHARKLKKGDQVYFTPATFDFEWLDTAASRFEIAYDEQGRRCSRANRPYLLDELGEIKEAWELISGSGGLTTSQVHALREVIESHREEWQASPQDETFQQLSRDAVRNAKWKGKPSDAAMDKLANWAASGLLTDVIELCMGIMKEKPSRDERAGETP